MSPTLSRRLVYASRFLKPPGFFKRALMRDKPRTQTGAFENPVRKRVRLREKAREFEEIPPPRKTPTLKPEIPKNKMFLNPVQGVPRVSVEVLQNRLDFLLGEKAIQQQLNAPMLPGQTPHTAELFVWERQMREIRKIYRAQYLQKLAVVTEEERGRELALYQQEQLERNERRLEKLQKKAIDMKRSALLQDRKRIEKKVNETVEMTRRSNLKIKKLKFLKLIQDRGTARDAGIQREEQKTNSKVTTSDTQLLNRNVSAPFLTRQLGGAVDLPSHKNRRIHKVDNVYREVLERSYDLHGEHEDEFGRLVEVVSEDEGKDIFSDPSIRDILSKDGEVSQPLFRSASEIGLSPQQRAELYYAGFSANEKLELIEQKIHMLQERQMAEEAKGSADPLTAQLMDLLAAAKAAHLEEEQVQKMKQLAKGDRDDSVE